MHTKPIPVSIGIIPSTVPEHVILVERSDGGYALPGGYVEELEDATAALNREVFEEISLALDPNEWRLFFSAVTPENKLLLFSYYPKRVALPDCFAPDAEIVRVFSAHWRTPLKFSFHQEALEKWHSSVAPFPRPQLRAV